MKDEKSKMVFTFSHEDPMKITEEQHGISYNGKVHGMLCCKYN